MVWLDPQEHEQQAYQELRLHAPRTEKVSLEFHPLKMSREPGWNPAWAEWHCYAAPLRIYRQDYRLLLSYFSRIYPTRDAFDGTPEPVFDVCSHNWIGKEEWLKFISGIEQNWAAIPDEQKPFFLAFLKWLKDALRHTAIIVVEGNL